MTTAATTTPPTKLQRPEAAVIRQDTAPPTPLSPSRGFFPLRRNSQHGNNNAKPNPNSNLGEQKPVPPPSSPPIANRRGSAIIPSNTANNRLNQSWFTEAGSDLSAGRGDRDTTYPLHGIDWDLEKGVKLENIQGAEVKGGRKSMSGVDGVAGEQQHVVDARSLLSTLNGGEEVGEEEEGWNHEHPCFPHPNPHVPLDSSLFQSTRIIRIPRDYMINGDNTPAFSIVYPVILEPYVTEEQFRNIVDTVNEKLRLAFDPWNRWNWMDAIIGLATFWLWEEIFPTYVKRRLREVEKTLEAWNATLKEQGATLIALRRSAYITVGHVTPYRLLKYVNTCYSLIYRYPIPYEEVVRMEVLWSRQGRRYTMNQHRTGCYPRRQKQRHGKGHYQMQQYQC